MNAPALCVIPARIGSTRLPRKPLLPLAGRPLIEWVWRRVVAMELFERIVIATDSQAIADAAGDFGATVELTDPGHPSGTDRIAEVVQREAYRGFDPVVNVQGDEPFIAREPVRAALSLVRDGDWEVGTGAAPITSVGEWLDPGVVKVVRDASGGALYFSRAPIPFRRDGAPGEAEFGDSFLRHLGVYAYHREALLRWVRLPESALERIERLEQLRPLAAGIRIGVEIVAPEEPGGIDTPEDARRAELRLRNQPSIPFAND